MNKVLHNKVAVITGANQGLGLEIAKKYVIAGAHVVICARDKDLLLIAADALRQLASPEQKIISQVADISQEIDVNKIVKSIVINFGTCHVLVNNAGVYGPKGAIDEVNWADWIKAIEINLCGSVLMARALIPFMKKQVYGKIIQLSGGGATNPLPKISAYAVSKAAIVRFAETLAEELRGTGIDVNSIAPGALNTRMLDEILVAGPEKVGLDFYARALKQKQSGGVPIDRGADLALFLASPCSNGITAKLISAVWDNWEEWPNYIKELDGSDIYTLRRVVGKDRGITWGDK